MRTPSRAARHEGRAKSDAIGAPAHEDGPQGPQREGDQHHPQQRAARGVEQRLRHAIARNERADRRVEQPAVPIAQSVRCRCGTSGRAGRRTSRTGRSAPWSEDRANRISVLPACGTRTTRRSPRARRRWRSSQRGGVHDAGISSATSAAGSGRGSVGGRVALGRLGGEAVAHAEVRVDVSASPARRARAYCAASARSISTERTARRHRHSPRRARRRSPRARGRARRPRRAARSSSNSPPREVDRPAAGTNAWNCSRAGPRRHRPGPLDGGLLERRGDGARPPRPGRYILRVARPGDPVVGADPQAADALRHGRSPRRTRRRQSGHLGADPNELVERARPKTAGSTIRAASLNATRVRRTAGAGQHALLPAEALHAPCPAPAGTRNRCRWPATRRAASSSW